MANRKLVVEIVGDASSLERAFKRSIVGSRRFSVGIGTIAKSAVVFTVVQRAIEGVTSALHSGIAEFTENQRVAAQTAAAIRSTGAAAGVSAKHIDDLGLRLSNLSGIDDEVVRAGENVLLSFTRIRNEAGKGNDVFDRATKAVVDYAARTGKDVPQAAILLGRALEDPASKLTALSRAGIVFTKQQIAQVRAIEKTRGVMAAQKVVLDELTKRFGGAAAAAGKTLSGQLGVLRDRFRDLAGQGVALLAPAFAKAVGGLTVFVRKLSEARGVHAKLEIVWEGIDAAGRALLAAFRRIPFEEIARTVGQAVARQLRRLGEFLSGVDFASVGRLVGAKIRAGLDKVSAVIGTIDWNKVGRKIIDGLGAAVVVVLNALPGILEGIGKLAVRVLAGVGQLLLGAGTELGKQLFDGIKKGIASIAGKLERLALTIVLKIIEPFSHLPRFLGGGPFQDLKDQFQRQLDGMVSAAQDTAGKIKNALAGVTKTSAGAPPVPGIDKPARAAGTTGAAAETAARAAGDAAVAATKKVAAKAAPAAAKAATKIVDESFVLPFRLRLAEAKADATKAIADDLKVERQIRAFILKAIPTLKGEKLISAYEALRSANDQIAAAVTAAADKTKKSAKTVDSAFKKADLSSLTKGLGLDPATVKALQARLSQIGPGGTVSARGVGAFGVPVAVAGGGTFTVNTSVNLDGREIARNTTRHQQKRAMRNPPQRRGPFAGGGL